MTRRKIVDFGWSVYKDGDNIDVVFRPAKKVPKAYDSFIATLELACLAQIQQFMNHIGKDKKDGKDSK